MNPVIVFDLGKVLVDFDYSIAARKIASQCRKPFTTLDHFLGTAKILERFESGQLTREQFFNESRNVIDFAGTIDDFVRDFADIFLPIQPMIELHADLRRRGFHTFIFSNTNDIAVEHISRNFPFFKNFDGYIYSYKVGSMKPQPEIYEAMESMCRRHGNDIIYIDDRPENIEAGKARGWKVILHETPEKTKAMFNGSLSAA